MLYIRYNTHHYDTRGKEVDKGQASMRSGITGIYVKDCFQGIPIWQEVTKVASGTNQGFRTWTAGTQRHLDIFCCRATSISQDIGTYTKWHCYIVYRHKELGKETLHIRKNLIRKRMLSQVSNDRNSESEADAWLMDNPTVILMETNIIEAPTSIPFVLVVISPACERRGLFDCTEHHQCEKQIENMTRLSHWVVHWRHETCLSCDVLTAGNASCDMLTRKRYAYRVTRDGTKYYSCDVMVRNAPITWRADCARHSCCLKTRLLGGDGTGHTYHAMCRLCETQLSCADGTGHT